MSTLLCPFQQFLCFYGWLDFWTLPESDLCCSSDLVNLTSVSVSWLRVCLSDFVPVTSWIKLSSLHTVVLHLGLPGTAAIGALKLCIYFQSQQITAQIKVLQSGWGLNLCWENHPQTKGCAVSLGGKCLARNTVPMWLIKGLSPKVTSINNDFTFMDKCFCYHYAKVYGNTMVNQSECFYSFIIRMIVYTVLSVRF